MNIARSKTSQATRNRVALHAVVSPRIRRHLKLWRKYRTKENEAVISELKERHRLMAYSHAETVCELFHGYL